MTSRSPTNHHHTRSRTAAEPMKAPPPIFPLHGDTSTVVLPPPALSLVGTEGTPMPLSYDIDSDMPVLSPVSRLSTSASSSPSQVDPEEDETPVIDQFEEEVASPPKKEIRTSPRKKPEPRNGTHPEEKIIVKKLNKIVSDTALDSEPAPKKRKRQRPPKSSQVPSQPRPVFILPDHITLIPGTPPLYKCKACLKTFRTKANCKFHICKKSNKPRPTHFLCDQCGMGFHTQSHYRYHLSTHLNLQELPFKCPVCKKGFITKRSLERHQIAHSSLRPYSCKICHLSFKQTATLKDHMTGHSTKSRQFGCSTCQKTFRTGSILKVHVAKFHETEGNLTYACDQCGNRFAKRHLLNSHKKTHTKKDPHVCKVCGKTFTLEKDLRRHAAAIHPSGGSPKFNKCHLCKAAFTRRYNLTAHLRLRHPESQEEPASNGALECDSTQLEGLEVANVDLILKDGDSNFVLPVLSSSPDPVTSQLLRKALEGEGREIVSSCADSLSTPLPSEYPPVPSSTTFVLSSATPLTSTQQEILLYPVPPPVLPESGMPPPMIIPPVPESGVTPTHSPVTVISTFLPEDHPDLRQFFLPNGLPAFPLNPAAVYTPAIDETGSELESVPPSPVPYFPTNGGHIPPSPPEAPVSVKRKRDPPDDLQNVVVPSLNSLETCLHELMRQPHDSFQGAVQYAVEHGVPINTKDKNGNNLLFLATYYRKTMTELKFIISLGGAWENVTNHNKQTILHLAAEGGNFPAVEYFLSLGADILCKDNFGEIPLHRLRFSDAKENFSATLNILLKQGSPINATNKRGDSLLFLTARCARPKKELEEIISRGGRWDQTNSKGQTILHLASEAGVPENLEYLFSLGANFVQETDLQGNTPLHQAVLTIRDFSKTVSFLIEHGANINAPNGNGDTPLFVAAGKHKTSKENLETLLSHGADWTIKNKKGQGILHVAVQGGNGAALELFTGLGADIHSRDLSGEAPIHMVRYTKMDLENTLQFLLEKEVDLDTVTESEEKETVLQLATRCGMSRQRMEKLREYGASWNRRNGKGQTILHVAAQAGNIGCLDYFIGLGADVNATSEDTGRTPLLEAAFMKDNKNFIDTVNLLRQHSREEDIDDPKDNEGNTLLLLAVATGRATRELEYLLHLGANVHQVNNKQQGVLHLAAEKGHSEMLKRFILGGLSPHVFDGEQNTPLHLAVNTEKDFEEVVTILVGGGGLINAGNGQGASLLFLAAEQGRSEEEIETIVKLGGLPNIRELNGFSPLHAAAQHGQLHVLRKLISLGSSTNAPSNTQRTPLHQAIFAEKNVCEMVSLLVENGSAINTVDDEGNNSLFIAAFLGKSLAEVKHLVNLGGDWQGKNKNGYNIIHLAANGANPEVVQYFIDKGADPKLVSEPEQRTTLHVTAFSPHPITEIVKLLIDHGVDLNAVDSQGNSLLGLMTIAGREMKEIDDVVELGADYHVVNKNGHTLLHLAGQGATGEVVQYFICLGLDVNSRSNDNKVPIHHVAYTSTDYEGKAAILINAQADINARDKDDVNLLLLSTVFGRTKHDLEMIVVMGGDWRVKYKNGISILHAAVEAGNPAAVEFFISRGAPMDDPSDKGEAPLHRIKKTQNCVEETLEVLAAKGANFEAVDKKGNNVIFAVTASGGTSLLIQQLIGMGVDWQQRNNLGETVVHLAVATENLEALKFFIDQGADVQVPANDGKTPLQYLALKEKRYFGKLFDLLLKAGAEVNQVDKEGNNLLFLAALHGRKRTDLEGIVKQGGNWKAKNDKNQNIAHVCVQGGNLEGLRYFCDLGVNPVARSCQEKTPLHQAAFSPKEKENFGELLAALVQLGGDINAVDDQGNTVFCYAAFVGRTKEELEYLESLEGSWEIVNKKGYSAIHLAAQGGSISALEYLIEKGADVNLVSSSQYRTPLHQAVFAKQNFPETVTMLIENGGKTSVDSPDVDGNTPFLLAILSGRSQEDVELLVKIGSSINAANKTGLSCLHLAAHKGSPEVLQYIISLGLDIDIRSNDLKTPSHHVVHSKEHFQEKLEILLEAKADINAVDKDKMNAIHLAAFSGYGQEILEKLIEKGADWNAKYKANYSILHVAVEGGNHEGLQFLISKIHEQKDPVVNPKGDNDEIPLHRIRHTKKNFPETLKVLKETGADMEAVTKNGYNALFLAVASGRTRTTLEHLVEAGVKWDGASTSGDTILHVAVEHGNLEGVKYFVGLGAEVNRKNKNGEEPIHRASLAPKNFGRILDVLVKAKADINAEDKDGNNLMLLCALKKRSKEEMEHILKLGGSGDWEAANNLGISVLNAVIEEGNVEKLKAFIALGVDVNKGDENGDELPIHRVVNAKENFEEMVTLLVENGANINRENEDGNNIVFLATLKGRRKEEVEYLVKLGGQWKGRNRKEESILRLAFAGTNLELFQLFVSLGADVKQM